MSETARDAVLANERLICGRQRTFLDWAGATAALVLPPL
jgi:hypothetical protein